VSVHGFRSLALTALGVLTVLHRSAFQFRVDRRSLEFRLGTGFTPGQPRHEVTPEKPLIKPDDNREVDAD
jgi:hypothetical protein